MSQFDAAVGMDKATLDRGFAQLYANPEAREKFFKGTQEGQQGTVKFTANWDARAAPTFVLEPPPPDKWAASINADGKNPKPEDIPTRQAFQLTFPEFYGESVIGTAAPVSGTTEVIVFATLAVEGDKLTIRPASVWLDESKMKNWDKFILNQVILKQVLQQAQKMLAGLNIPPLSFSEAGATIELTPPVVEITQGLLVVAASLKSKGTVDVSGATWPSQPFFVLMSKDLITQTVQGLSKSLMEKPFSGDGKYKGASYDYTLQPKTLGSISWTNLPKISAGITFAVAASVSISDPCALTSAAIGL
jgi:hypothetical protein